MSKEAAELLVWFVVAFMWFCVFMLGRAVFKFRAAAAKANPTQEEVK